jgi:hypothetical protein
MAYTGWNRFGSGNYWPGLRWNRMEPVVTGSNFLEPV